jgi:hypothetical protein
MGSGTDGHRAYNVTAEYPDMQRARAGVEVLEERGIEATAISLTGGAARQAAANADTAQRDRAWLSFTGQAAKRGVLIGLVAGAILGAIVGIVTTGETAGTLAATLGLAAAGAGLGAFAGVLSRQKVSGAFEDTFDDSGGAVVVGVHTDDQAAYEKAAEALAGTGPEHIRRFDARGDALPDAGDRTAGS